MNRLSTAACSAVLLLFCGCVTHVNYVDLTGNIMVDGPNMIANGPPRDRVLWQDRTASAALREGDDALAKQYLDDTLTRLGGIYGPDKSAQKARSYFHSESEKTFIGEPYERVMAYYYRGIIYWKDGELDNARACFRSGEIEDSSSEGDQYSADYVLLDYLDGLATVKIGGDGSDAFARSQKESHFAKPPPYDPAANVLFFVEFGPGPRKYASGAYGDELFIAVPQSPIQSAVIKVADQTIPIGPYDDLGFQARTRGGRVMDHVLAGKAVFKAASDAGGDFGIISGAMLASSYNRTADEVGLGLIAAGAITKAISSSVRPRADTRTWDDLPRYLTFAALDLPPGLHEATVEFIGTGGQTLAYLTKTVTINVPADKHAAVVFVSDHSKTPLSQ
jgi:hypothetical protein